MKNLTLYCALSLCLSANAFAQNLVWMASSDASSPTRNDQAFTTELDLSGNHYVAGNYADTLFIDGIAYPNYLNDGSNDAYIAKYDANGNVLWMRTINGPSSQLIKSMKVNATTGDCYVSGSFIADLYVNGTKLNSQTFSGFSTNFYRSFIMRFDTNGNLIWSDNTFSISGYAIDGGESIALSPLGDYVYMQNGYIGDVVFESGPSYLPSGFGVQGILLTKMSTSTGAIVASRNDIERYLVDGYILETDKVGNVIYAGSHRRTCMFEVDPTAFGTCDTNPAYAIPDGFVWKMNSSFGSIWGKEINGTGFEIVSALGTDAQNNIYIYGTFTSNADFNGTVLTPVAGKSNAFVAKLNSAGNYVYLKQFSADQLYMTEYPTDAEAPFAVDAKGNTFLGGAFSGTLDFNGNTLTSDILPFLFYANGYLIKLNSSGNFRWAEKFEGTTGPFDETAVHGISVLGSYLAVGGEFANYNVYQTDTVFADANAYFISSIQDCDVTIQISASSNLVSVAFPVTLSTPIKPGYSYQWQRNNVDIPGATSNTYVTTLTGNYKVIVTAGVCEIASRRIKLNPHPRFGNIDDATIAVYPNPANENIYIQLPPSQVNTTFSLIISDLSGRTVYSENTTSDESGLMHVQLQNSISSGTYFIQLIGDNYSATTPIVIE
ncbi:MAG TPA: T9SS type A sorting domain-containing protein [Chitinophagales bacterium]|nr:T9SS type A sorting domain-containing protein [Chitinophagales bacterium]